MVNSDSKDWFNSKVDSNIINRNNHIKREYEEKDFEKFYAN